MVRRFALSISGSADALNSTIQATKRQTIKDPSGQTAHPLFVAEEKNCPNLVRSLSARSFEFGASGEPIRESKNVISPK